MKQRKEDEVVVEAQRVSSRLSLGTRGVEKVANVCPKYIAILPYAFLAIYHYRTSKDIGAIILSIILSSPLNTMSAAFLLQARRIRKTMVQRVQSSALR